MLRKALVFLRRSYAQELKKYLLIALAVVVGAGLLGVLLDVFLPFVLWANVLRMLVLIPLASALFSLGYFVSLYLHYTRMDDESRDWVPYRLRFSLAWRRRIALVVLALLIVLIYATSFGPAYTFLSSIIAATSVALSAFVRPASSELMREELNIPDMRDIHYEVDRDKRREARLAAQQNKSLRGSLKNPMEKLLKTDKDDA